MWSKEKPENLEPEQFNVVAVAFEGGNIFEWLESGAIRDVFKISYNQSASIPYTILHKEWEIDSIGAFPFQPFMRWFTGRNFYNMKPHWELVVRDPTQLREYAFIGVKQGIPASLIVGL